MDVNRYYSNTTGDTLICGQCKTAFNSLNVYLDHKKSCYLVTNEIEGIKESKDLYNLNCHTLNTTITHKFSCETCKKEFKKYKSLELHRKMYQEKTYQCPLCGRCFAQCNHLHNHLHTHKVWPDGLNDTTSKETSAQLLSYSCPYCDVNLSNYNQFRGHLKTHLPLKRYKCVQNNCVELFENLDTLLNHVTDNHIPQVFNCYLCSNEFSSLTDIALHLHHHKKVYVKPKYKCDHCDAIYVKKSTLVLHLATANHNNTCIHCSKSFTSDKRLRLHLQTHKDIKPLSCDTCGLRFRIKRYLRSHMLKHGESKFFCKICNTRFTRTDTLTRHMKIHQNAKKLQCPFKDKLGCKMKFYRKDKLNQHVIYHTNNMTIISKKEKKKEKQGSTLEILIVPVTE